MYTCIAKLKPFVKISTKNVKIKLVKNAVLAGNTWTNQNTNNSILEYSTNGTVTGGILLFAFNLGKVGASNIIKFTDNDNIYITKGESISVEFTTASSSTIDVDITMTEDL